MQKVPSSRNQKLIAVGTVLALAILSLQAYTLLAGGALKMGGLHNASASTITSANGTISVTGNGLVQVQPDTAVITIGVNTQDSSAQIAAQQNADTMSRVIAALGNLGINSSDIQTVSYDIYPQTTYSNGVTSVVGYQVENEVQVTVTASGAAQVHLGSQAGAAFDAAVAQGANQAYGVQFTISSSALKQANERALQLAVQDAGAQANAIADTLNVTITGVLSISTSPTYVPSPIMEASTPSGLSQTPILPPQSLTISASVQAVYAIS